MTNIPQEPISNNPYAHGASAGQASARQTTEAAGGMGFGFASGADAATKPIVRLIDLRKRYVMGAKHRGMFRKQTEEAVVVHALKGVTLTINQGEFVSVMGASGSGKSTVLNLLGCLDRPTSGEYYLGERDVSKLSDDELSEVRSRYIGFIFQSYNLIQQYTVVENIQIPLTYQGSGELTDEHQRRTLELARMVGLDTRLDHRPNQLSGGQQQRVAIARSLINDPYIILADEATGNLDSVTSGEIMEMLCRLNDSGKTIIMVTHEDDIAEYAKRIIRMKDGVVQEDTPSVRARSAKATSATLTPLVTSGAPV